MEKTVIIRPGLLIDGTGREPIERPSILIRDGMIQDIDRAGNAPAFPPPDVKLVAAPDLCLLPGLIDAHVHLSFSVSDDVVRELLRDDDDTILLRATHNAQVALCAGITTVRDCGARRQTVLSLRNAIAQGIVAGPRIVACGMPITTTGGHCYWLGLEADSIDEVRKAARSQARAGADFFKVMATGGGLTKGTNIRGAQYGTSHLAAVVEEGQRLGKKVAVHAHAAEGIRKAVSAGVDIIEHSSWLAPREGVDFDERTADEMARRGIYVTPTVLAGYRSFKAGLRLTADRRQMFELREQRLACHRKEIQAGVRMLAGTDAGCDLVPLDSLAENLEAMLHELEMTSLAVIQTATRDSADALGLGHEIGTVEVGKRADLILVEGNPLTDITLLRRVRWVLQNGRVVARDGMLSAESGLAPA